MVKLKESKDGQAFDTNLLYTLQNLQTKTGIQLSFAFNPDLRELYGVCVRRPSRKGPRDVGCLRKITAEGTNLRCICRPADAKIASGGAGPSGGSTSAVPRSEAEIEADAARKANAHNKARKRQRGARGGGGRGGH